MERLKNFWITSISITILLLVSSFSFSAPADDSIDSITILEDQLSNAKKKFEHTKIVDLTVSIALLHSDHGNYIKTSEYLKKALALSERQDYLKGLYLSTNNLGNFYLRAGFYDRALDYYFRALAYADEIGEESERATVLNNLGVAYSSIGDNKNALSFFLEALVISQSMNDDLKIANNTSNIGSLYKERGDLDQALVYFERAEVIYEKIGKSRSLGVIKSNIADVYDSVGDTVRSLACYNEATELLRKEYDSYLLTNNLLSQTRLMFRCGQYDRGLISLEEAMTITQITNNYESYQRIYGLLETYYQEENKIDSAYTCRILSSMYADSVSTIKNANLLQRYQAKSELRNKEEELRELQVKARYRMFTVGGSVFILVIIMIAALLWYKERFEKVKKEKELSIVSLEKAAKEQEKLQYELVTREKINLLKQDKLQTEVDHKNRELATVTMHILSKNEILTQLKSQLKDISAKEMNQDSKRSVKKMNVEIQKNLRADHDWDNFKLHFEQVHPGFFDRLLEQFSTLNANDLRLCAYILMDLSSKEISQLFNISPDSVRKRRQRLRTKLSLTADDNVKLYLSQLS